MDSFPWPVTRRQACGQLDHFVTERLPEFGPYQDAMRGDDWAMSHALLGSAINLGLLHPTEVIERVETAYESAGLPLNSVEGVIRQILGWREFMRHVYRHAMPELATANQLDATRDLPEFYWTGETDMNCLAETVDDVSERGYSHHIQRLMVLANFATLWGVEPAELNEWFHATYVDAYHWVTTPNVVEMGQYGHGVFASKPYVSSGSYVDRMSDYCGDCHYYKTKDTGDRACPFNALYWDFLDRNEKRLRSNHRMGLMYSHVDDKRESGEIAAVRERVAELREMAAAGDL
jgi:deoxyribodipyrimidine photolyase-related protein